jgi:hypothetical protein
MKDDRNGYADNNVTCSEVEGGTDRSVLHTLEQLGTVGQCSIILLLDLLWQYRTVEFKDSYCRAAGFIGSVL